MTTELQGSPAVLTGIGTIPFEESTPSSKVFGHLIKRVPSSHHSSSFISFESLEDLQRAVPTFSQTELTKAITAVTLDRNHNEIWKLEGIIRTVFSQTFYSEESQRNDHLVTLGKSLNQLSGVTAYVAFYILIQQTTDPSYYAHDLGTVFSHVTPRCLTRIVELEQNHFKTIGKLIERWMADVKKIYEAHPYRVDLLLDQYEASPRGKHLRERVCRLSSACPLVGRWEGAYAEFIQEGLKGVEKNSYLIGEWKSQICSLQDFSKQFWESYTKEERLTILRIMEEHLELLERERENHPYRPYAISALTQKHIDLIRQIIEQDQYVNNGPGVWNIQRYDDQIAVIEVIIERVIASLKRTIKSYKEAEKAKTKPLKVIKMQWERLAITFLQTHLTQRKAITAPQKYQQIKEHITTLKSLPTTGQQQREYLQNEIQELETELHKCQNYLQELQKTQQQVQAYKGFVERKIACLCFNKRLGELSLGVLDKFRNSSDITQVPRKLEKVKSFSLILPWLTLHEEICYFSGEIGRDYSLLAKTSDLSFETRSDADSGLIQLLSEGIQRLKQKLNEGGNSETSVVDYPEEFQVAEKIGEWFFLKDLRSPPFSFPKSEDHRTFYTTYCITMKTLETIHTREEFRQFFKTTYRKTQ